VKFLLAAGGLALIGQSLGCTLADIRHNLVSGSLSFVEDYATDFWDAVFPPPGDILGQDDTE